MVKQPDEPLFRGDIAATGRVQVEQVDDTLVLKLEESLAGQLGLTAGRLVAATAEVGDGQVVLLVSEEAAGGPIQVLRQGGERLEVILTRAEASDTDEAAAAEADLVVDEVSEAFLALKKAAYTRGDLDLSQPMSAEDVEALGSDQFERLERRLK